MTSSSTIPTLTGWRKVTRYDLPPDSLVVWTKIHDEHGARNEQKLKRMGNLWFVPDGSVYVHYTPTHWRYSTKW